MFGWWKGRFDNGYPHYEPDEELGGAEKLKENIAKVRAMGGHVILYNNGILIDKKSDFYRDHAKEAARIDIETNTRITTNSKTTAPSCATTATNPSSTPARRPTRGGRCC